MGQNFSKTSTQQNPPKLIQGPQHFTYNNGPFLIGDENGNGKCLREGAIYDVKIAFFPFDEDDDDGFRPHGAISWAKEVSKTRYTKLLNHTGLSFDLEED